MLEVMQAGNRRIVVLTETHVALMRVRVAAVRSVYRAMWKVRLTKIQTVRGNPPPSAVTHRLPCLVAPCTPTVPCIDLPVWLVLRTGVHIPIRRKLLRPRVSTGQQCLKSLLIHVLQCS